MPDGRDMPAAGKLQPGQLQPPAGVQGVPTFFPTTKCSGGGFKWLKAWKAAFQSTKQANGGALCNSLLPRPPQPWAAAAGSSSRQQASLPVFGGSTVWAITWRPGCRFGPSKAWLAAHESHKKAGGSRTARNPLQPNHPAQQLPAGSCRQGSRAVP